ncbi:MAG: cell shape-determining protein, partial [Anaerolineales bacterium]|nr:cell shape-determining protein [Anaerolineales bacterium]
TATILEGDLEAAGPVTVTVFNPAPGGGASNGVLFTVTNAAPTISLLEPATVVAGSQAFSLTVRGSGFSSGEFGSVVRWNGADRQTVYVTRSRVRATISSNDVQTAGVYSVTVFNPTPGGGASNGVLFTVTNPVPVITALAPISKTVGDPTFTLVITGSGFVSSSVVMWAGQSRPMTYTSSTRLEATIYDTDLTTARVVSITVSSPGPGGGTSNQASFTVSPASGGASLGPIGGDPWFALDASGPRLIVASAERRDWLDQGASVSGVSRSTALLLPSGAFSAAPRWSWLGLWHSRPD